MDDSLRGSKIKNGIESNVSEADSRFLFEFEHVPS